MTCNEISGPRYQAPAGACPKCHGQVWHRPGKPGEYDHDCPETTLVSAEEYYGGGTRCPVMPESEVGKRLLATLRHYEAEVGQFKEDNDRLRRGADLEIKRLLEALAREAPFAALGRYIVNDDGTFGKVYNDLIRAARAALAVEEKAKEPVWSEPAPSGKIYRRDPAKLGLWVRWANATPEEVATVALSIPVEDAAFVAKLMGAKND